jgi:hypothetical protein
MLAMAEHEGWEAIGSVKNAVGTRAYRHHNPGNLRASPFAERVVDGFAVFKNCWLGFNAFQWDLTQKAKGNTSTGLGPESTLRDLIYTWAPPSDNNNSEAYLESVVKMTGFPADMQLKYLLDG